MKDKDKVVEILKRYKNVCNNPYFSNTDGFADAILAIAYNGGNVEKITKVMKEAFGSTYPENYFGRAFLENVANDILGELKEHNAQ